MKMISNRRIIMLSIYSAHLVFGVLANNYAKVPPLKYLLSFLTISIKKMEK